MVELIDGDVGSTTYDIDGDFSDEERELLSQLEEQERQGDGNSSDGADDDEAQGQSEGGEGEQPQGQQQATDDGGEDYDWNAAIKEQMFDVDFNGSTLQVNGEELLSGYVRQEEAARQTEALRQQRVGMEQQVQDQVLAHYGQQLREVQGLLHSYLQREPDPRLAQTDPSSYASQVQAYHENAAVYQSVQDELQNLAHHQNEQAQQQEAAARQSFANELAAWKPELKTREAFTAYQAKLADHAVHYGFSPEEASLADASDVRMVRVMDDAIKYRELKAAQQKLAAQKKGKTPRPPVFDGKGRSKAQSSQQQFNRSLDKATEEDLVKMLAAAGG